jgi:phage-related protein
MSTRPPAADLTSRSSSLVSSNPRDIKDTAVLTGALRALGNELREPRSKSLDRGLFELRGTRARIYYGFLPGRRAVLLGGYLKKRTDTPSDVLRLMRVRLKEVYDEYEKSRAGPAGKKGR